MATTWRIVYHWDDETIKKEKREFSLTDEIMELINSWWGWGGWAINWVKVNWQIVNPDQAWYVWLTIPWVINNLASNSTTDALSAKQWKVLYEYIQALQHVWHFLALWNTATWLPVTNPETSPYTYNTWDYYIVSNVAAVGWTNYKPNGSSYTINVASTTVESWEVQVNDLYFYDWYERRLLDNSWWGSSVAIDTSLSTTSTNPVQNQAIANAINNLSTDVNTKTFYLASAADFTNAQAAVDWIDAWKMALVCFNWQTYVYISKTSTKYTFEDINWYTTVNSNWSTWVFLNFLEITLDNGDVDDISISSKSQSSTIPSYLATWVNYSPVYTPEYNGSPATKKYVDDKFAAVPVYTAGSNIDITANQISTIRNWYVYVTCTDWAFVQHKTGTSAEGNYTPTEWDLVMVHFTQGCSVWWPTIAIDWWTAIPFYIWVEWANAGNMYFGSNNVSKMFIYTDGKLVWDAVKDNNTTYSAWAGLALNSWVFSNTQPWPTVSATAPANPSEWDMWYDTDNDVLKVYNGSSWDEAWWGEAIDLVAWDGIIINSIWSDLPDWYTQLQSISSSGSQYILTWINYASWHTYEFTHKLFVNSATDASKWTWWNAWGWLMMINQSWIKYSWGWTSSLIGDAWQELEVTISIWNWTSTYDYTIWWTTWSLTRSNTSLASYNGNVSYPLFVTTVNNGWWTIYVGSEMTATYYYFEAKDNGTLVRKMYPAKRNADNAIWMYDVVNNVFYANSWSWSFVPWPIVPVGWLEISAIPYVWWTDIEVVLWEAKRLPNWYTEVEWIQSDGSCAIDSGITIAQMDKAVIVWNFVQNQWWFRSVLWADNQNASTWWKYAVIMWEWSGWQYYTESVEKVGTASGARLDYVYSSAPVDTNEHVFQTYYAGTTAYLQVDNYIDTIQTCTRSTWVTTTLWIFARHLQASDTFAASSTIFKMKSIKMRNLDTVVFEWVPCKRDSDNAIGLYDLVSETFLENEGSGTFTAWPEVTYNPANVINYTGSGSNTKTFFFSWNLMDQSNLETALSIIDWLYDWDMPSSWSRPIDKNPIVVYNDWNWTYNKAFHLEWIYDYSWWLHMVFERTIWNVDDYHLWQIEHEDITLSITWHSTSNIALYDHNDYKNFLSTTNTISYTPTADYNPATKKYVDDAVGSITIPSIAVVNNSSVVNATPSWGDLHTLTLSDTANTVTKSYVDGKISSWTTAPSSPTEWMLWYDTTNDELKVYDWTTWNVTWGWIKLAANSPLTVTEIWAGTESQYNSLSSKWATTAYLCVEE